MADITVGPPQGEEDLKAFLAEQGRTYNRSTEEGEQWRSRVDPADLRLVRTNGRVAGGLRLLQLGQWFGGRTVPMTGIGAVGIDPQSRGTGLASELMRSVVAELASSGIALSALFPATVPVYRRVGYELAGSYVNYSIAANAIDVRDRTLSVELCENVDRTLLERLYTERARITNGNLDRRAMWDFILDPPKTTVHVYVVSDEGEPQGYVVFTQPSADGWNYDLSLRDVVALTPAAGRRIWSFLADHRSFVGKVRWTGPVGDPFAFHLREQDWDANRNWSWMLRVLDVERALNERGYPAAVETDLHLDITDDVLPANAGRFVLEVSGGKGDLRRGGDGRIAIDIRGLAPLYSGFLGAEQLKATGYIEGQAADLARATAIFAGPAPWLADSF